MTTQQIQTFLSPPNVAISQEKALVSLNSQFQSLDALNGLEIALQHAKERSDDLKAQLSISRAKIDTLVAETQASAHVHLTSAQELSLLRHSLADELSYLSQELVSSISHEGTLLEDIETLHRNLKELQSIKGYVQIVERALNLAEKATKGVSNATAISKDSVAEYRLLQEFVAEVSRACSQVEDGPGKPTLQLVQFLEHIRDNSWSSIKNTLSGSFLAAAEKLQWPMPVDYTSANPDDRKAFEGAFINLLRLQDIGREIHHGGISSEKEGLYPIQALIQPLSLRFKYHFEGTRQTNRLDKPEWYFTHVLNAVNEHRPFMESIIQQLLSASQHGSNDAWREFTLLSLALPARKLKRTIPTLLSHPSLLAHTIYQALSFDATLIDEGFRISGTTASKAGPDGTDVVEKWDGVSDVILGRKEWFEAWLEGERQFAENQYNEIISATDAWLVTDDEGSEGHHERDMKATDSARRIKALVEQVTDRYSPLPNLTQRTRFLISVQLPILELYHGRISSSLDAFETLSSAFVRAVPGALGVSLGGKEEVGVRVDTGSLTSGVEGVQRLCKALLSAKYLQMSMEGWGEESFFLELWSEINQQASLRALAEANSSLPDPKPSEIDAPQDTIFQELILQYGKLVDRTEGMIVQQVCGEIEAVLKAHFSAVTSSGSDATQNDEIALSQTLLTPIALLSSHLTFLRSTLSPILIATLYRSIASRLAEHIFQRRILYRGRFNVREGKRILAECELWVETCRAAMGGGRNRTEAPWLKLLEAGRLVSVEGDIWLKIVNSIFETNSDDEWEGLVGDIIGSNEMGREEVRRVLRIREDCPR